MKSILVFIAGLGFTLSSWAQAEATYGSDPSLSRGQAILLISMDPDFYPKGLTGLFYNYKHYPAKIEQSFRQKFANQGFDLRVIQGATRADLFKVMNSMETRAVFWVSHEAPISWSNKKGLALDPLLVDKNGADVKDLFLQISPSIEWVSIVACDSQLVLNWVQTQADQDVKTRPLRWQGFPKAVDAIQALKQSLREARAFFSGDNLGHRACVPENSWLLHIKRTLSVAKDHESQFLPAVTLSVDGKILAAFQETFVNAGTSFEQKIDVEVPIDRTQPPPARRRALIESGLNPMNLPRGFNLGDFEIEDSMTGKTWQVFAKSDGMPFGVTERLFSWQGAEPLDSDLGLSEGHNCRMHY